MKWKKNVTRMVGYECSHEIGMHDNFMLGGWDMIFGMVRS